MSYHPERCQFTVYAQQLSQIFLYHFLIDELQSVERRVVNGTLWHSEEALGKCLTNYPFQSAHLSLSIYHGCAGPSFQQLIYVICRYHVGWQQIFVHKLCSTMEDVTKNTIVYVVIILIVRLSYTGHIFIKEHQFASDIVIDGCWRKLETVLQPLHDKGCFLYCAWRRNQRLVT